MKLSREELYELLAAESSLIATLEETKRDFEGLELKLEVDEELKREIRVATSSVNDALRQAREVEAIARKKLQALALAETEPGKN